MQVNTTSQPLYVQRWMIRRDMPEIMTAENLCGGLGWSEEEFLRVLRLRTCIGKVAERGCKEFPVHGFMIYELDRYSFRLLNIGVHPEWQRSGAASAMLNYLKGKIPNNNRTQIIADVPDHLLSAHLFLQSHGFKCTKIIGESYQMIYSG